MSHKIYALYADVDDVGFPLIRYVGYTSKTLKERLIQHLSEARTGRQSHRCKWIRSVFSGGKTVQILLLEAVDGEDWQAREQFWIAKFGLKLTNGTAGGDGLINPSEEVRKRISEKVSILMAGNSYRKGIPHTEETRIKLSRTLLESEKMKAAWERKRGVPLSDEHKRKLSAATKGRKKSTDHLKKMRAAVRPSEELAERMRGRRWATDGISDILVKAGDAIPDGFRLGRSKHQGKPNKGASGYVHSDETRAKMSAAASNFNWINDGVSLKKLQKGDPLPAGWVFGKKIPK